MPFGSTQAMENQSVLLQVFHLHNTDLGEKRPTINHFIVFIWGKAGKVMTACLNWYMIPLDTWSNIIQAFKN